MRLAGIEAGGTKFVLAIGTDSGEVIKRIEIPTRTPQETMEMVVEFFKNEDFEALGLGCFGPIDPNLKSDTYGFITKTPKVAWQDFNIVGYLKQHFNVPIMFDTDVNGAALGELKWGAARGVDSSLYITVGTGIGAGAVVCGKMINGLLHPEMGHILVKRHESDDFEGICAIHGDCLEGLASGVSIQKRWGMTGSQLPKDHIGWEIEAYYLAQALVNYILILSPERIIMGGGVMKQQHILPLIRKKVQELLNGYIQKDELIGNIDEYIVAPDLGQNAGICGALALAEKALSRNY